MKAYRLIVVFALGLLALAACDTEQELTQVQIEGTGNLSEQQRDIAGFDRIEAHYAFDVVVTWDEAFGVRLTVDDSLDEHLDVARNDDTLVLTLDSDNSYSIDEDVTMIAEITMPALHGITLSGASTAEVRGFVEGEPFEAQLSGESVLEGVLEVGDTTLELSGSSEVLLTGSAQNVMLTTSGASVADLTEFDAQDVSIAASGSSRLIVNLDGTLTVDASGSSEVQYLGDVTLGEIETSGSATVNPQ